MKTEQHTNKPPRERTDCQIFRSRSPGRILRAAAHSALSEVLHPTLHDVRNRIHDADALKHFDRMFSASLSSGRDRPACRVGIYYPPAADLSVEQHAWVKEIAEELDCDCFEDALCTRTVALWFVGQGQLEIANKLFWFITDHGLERREPETELDRILDRMVKEAFA